ncbi:hypothetical protein BJ508DRAFT_308969 [Ascobolus immersus RN42]|uniref:Uncharacterized protein n=1 Tax=Ascobolus immersus RN42 TaxID=1160509 RepID=A0A3N4I3X9_ASCIM|nr:hypothetical protein BJ508DRAFT_308969 [Ascobolus immersus RN42]
MCPKPRREEYAYKFIQAGRRNVKAKWKTYTNKGEPQFAMNNILRLPPAPGTGLNNPPICDNRIFPMKEKATYDRKVCQYLELESRMCCSQGQQGESREMAIDLKAQFERKVEDCELECSCWVHIFLAVECVSGFGVRIARGYVQNANYIRNVGRM